MSRAVIVVGSSSDALDELRQAREIAPDAALFPVKRALAKCPAKPVAYATLHPEQVIAHVKGVDLEGVQLFCGEIVSRKVPGQWRIVREKWTGTTALYAVQIALEVLDFERVILAGVPIDSAHGANYQMRRPVWANGYEERYRKSWRAALPLIKDRVRSMSGWTRELLGAPSIEWLKDGDVK